KLAFPESSLGLIMPIESLPEDRDDALLLADTIHLDSMELNLTDTFSGFAGTLSVAGSSRLASANIKPRMRMIALYYVANLRNYLVLGTGNLSEITVGYSTKFGDSGADLLPLANCTKGEVMKLAGALGVPQRIIDKPPSAGLWQGQTDENEMGILYSQIEAFLKGGDLPDEVRGRISARMDRNKHKTRMPDAFIE
ncbi:MAG: NAD(+) synthase, partial [Candidatus Wallbacteria bacterium]|nr:NAD(+) synthase [Candidatus Wallbacteria bacterium]